MAKEICELNRNELVLLVKTINIIMVDKFDISQNSINEFWKYFETGAHMHNNV